MIIFVTSNNEIVQQATRHAESRKLDIKAFVYRPIPRLLRYDLLLKGIISASPPDHEDKEAIPQVLEVIKALGRDSEPGVVSAKQKVELWKYNANLVFKPGEIVVCIFVCRYLSPPIQLLIPKL